MAQVVPAALTVLPRGELLLWCPQCGTLTLEIGGVERSSVSPAWASQMAAEAVINALAGERDPKRSARPREMHTFVSKFEIPPEE